ncbi:MAG TPA: hypothetical protein ENN55_03765 [Firmicutes bacterium]|nr:hypothetical protein [Bacillota bacterium]
MKKISVYAVIAAMLVMAGCAGVQKRVPAGYALAGAGIVSGAAAGGAFTGAEISKNNDASDTAAFFITTGTAAVFGIAAGIIYDFFLEILGVKEEVPEESGDFEEDESILMPAAE